MSATHGPNPENDVFQPDELLADLRAGHTDLAPLVVSFFGGRLYTYVVHAFAFLSDLERETVCERAVEKAIAKIDKYDPDRGSFDAWLRAFSRYEVANLVRSPGRELAMVFEPDDHQAILERRPVPESTRTALTQALANLSRVDQLIISLRAVELLDYKTIARYLDSTEAACRQRYRRALNRLRLEFEPLAPHPIPGAGDPTR